LNIESLTEHFTKLELIFSKIKKMKRRVNRELVKARRSNFRGCGGSSV